MCEGTPADDNDVATDHDETPPRRNHHPTLRRPRRRFPGPTTTTTTTTDHTTTPRPSVPAVDVPPAVWVKTTTTTPPPLPEGAATATSGVRGVGGAGRLRPTPPAWQRCSLVAQTPQFLASVQLEDDSSVANGDSWSPAAGLLWLETPGCLVAGTLQGHVCVWDVSRAIASEVPPTATVPPSSLGDPTASQTPPSPPLSGGSSVPALRVVDLPSFSETPRGTKQEVGCVVGLAAVTGASQVGGNTHDPETNSDDPKTNRDSHFPFIDLVVAATDLGVVAGIRATTGDVAFQFDTKSCGVTSVAVVSSTTVRTDSTEASTVLSILVGYDVGVLEVWEVAVADTPKSASDPTPAHTTPSKRKKTPAKLIAKAVLESRYAIRAMVPFHRRSASQGGDTEDATPAASPLVDAPLPTTTDTVSNNAVSTSSSSEEGGAYVLMTLEPDRQQSTANLVEVIDLRAMQVPYEAALNEDNDTPSDGTSRTPAPSSSLGTPVLLEAHRVLAGAGMEIRDASGGVVGSMADGTGRNRFRVPWIPSSGAHRAADLRGLRFPGKDASPWCAVGLADGTVGVVSAIDESEDGWSWGIASEANQLQFSYPCIGMGCVSMEHCTRSDELGDAERLPLNDSSCLVCCLRGGTTYFLPLSDGNSRDTLIRSQPPTLRVVTYPHEHDADASLVQHVQGFAAGNVRLDGSNGTGTGSSIPIIALAWPSGILEVFSCQLQSESTSLPTSLYQSLEDSGALSELLQLLLLREKHSEEDGSGGDAACGSLLWSAARQEVLAKFDSPQGPPDGAEPPDFELLRDIEPPGVASEPPEGLSLSRADLNSPSFQALRQLLLHLSKE